MSAVETVRFTPRTPGFTDVMQSEWTKLRSVRSTPISLAVAAALIVGLGAVISRAHAASYHHGDPAWDPTWVSLIGFKLGQLAVATLGVLVISSEYSSGLIRASLAAVPRRRRLLAAKAAIFTVVVLAVGEVSSVTSFLVGQALMSGQAPTASLAQAASLRAVFGAGVYLAVLGLVAVAAGTLLRSAVGALAAVVAILFVLPGIVGLLSGSLGNTLTKYWPTQAGAQIFTVKRTADTLGPWAGLTVFCLFAAIVVAAAFLQLERRDA
jgi:ABC-2 type transport system permease protein